MVGQGRSPKTAHDPTRCARLHVECSGISTDGACISRRCCTHSGRETMNVPHQSLPDSILSTCRIKYLPRHPYDDYEHTPCGLPVPSVCLYLFSHV